MQIRFLALALAAATLDLTAQDYRSVDVAPINTSLSPLTSTFLSIPGVFTDMVRAGGGQFVEFADGSARLTCRVFAQSNLYAAFLVDIAFSGKVTPVDPSYPPASTPDRRLYGSAYSDVGGPIDSGAFSYYTAASGTLTGVRNFLGNDLTLSATHPVQVGIGANNTNDHFGLFGEFALTVTQGSLAPTGPMTLSLDFATSSSEPTTHPQVVDGLSSLPDGRAMVIPGVADDYVFAPAGDFREFDDGTATLAGRLTRVGAVDDVWHVSLQFAGRVDPSQPSYPPVGSPVLQLLPSAYEQNGGPIDPGHWHYYTDVTGTLTGDAANAGGQIDLVQSVAAQVGAGANQTGSYFGFYDAFTPTVVQQPSGHSISVTGDIEMFALTAVFPVLPFPSLTVPPSNPTLPTLSADGVVIEGENLLWVELTAFGFDLHGKGDGTDFFGGWFEVIDNEHIELHPRPDHGTGTFDVRVYNPAFQSNAVQVDLVTPAGPTLVAETGVGTFGTVHAVVHPGPSTGPVFSLMTLSQTLLPSVYPGFASLDIGNNFTDLVLDPSLFAHDPSTGLSVASYGPLDPALAGLTFHFQALILDAGVGTLPLPATNPWQVDFL